MIMSMANNIKRNVEGKEKENAEQALRATFNIASKKLIDTFLAEANSGSIKVESVTDLSRLFQIYTEINNLSTGDNSGGTLPALSPKERDVFANTVNTYVDKNDAGEDEEYVDMEELLGLSGEDVKKILVEKEQVMNKQNEEIG